MSVQDIVGPGSVVATDWHPELGEPVAGQDGFIVGCHAAAAREP
ncbi:hypothetical protein [Streptomyces sp. YIM S03343]